MPTVVLGAQAGSTPAPFAPDREETVAERTLQERFPACREVVEVITDYLEDRMTVDERERLERHIATCDGCATYLDQMRLSIRATGVVHEEAIPEWQRVDLITAFRELFA